MQLTSAVILGLFIVPPAALALVVSPRAQPITHAVQEAAMSLSQLEELRRETQDEEKRLFGHSEDETAGKEAKELEGEAEADVGGLKLGGSSSAALGPSACQASGRTKFNGKFDVVISWWTGGFQSNLRNVALFQENKSGIENQNEITYLLRGIDQFGMLPHVNKIFIVMDRAVVQAHGAPRYVNWNHPKIKAVFAQDLGCQAHPGPYGLHASFHKIPGISDWFLYIMDDIFVTKKFSLSYLFNAGKPRFWKGVDHFTPAAPKDCPTQGRPRVQTGHQPWIVNKCYMEQVERENLWAFKRVRTQCHNPKHCTICPESCFSAMCAYDSWVNGYGLTSPAFDPGHHYGLVCHLGIGWPADCAGNAKGPAAYGALLRVLARPPMFLNIQGSGISDNDEKASYPADARVKAKLTQWFHTFFKPSSLTRAVPSSHQFHTSGKKPPLEKNSFDWVFRDP